MINFILGVLFCVVFLPVIESLVELIQLAIERKKGKYALEIAKLNKEVAETTQPTEEEFEGETVAIGFHAPESEEEFDEDDDF